MGIDQEEVKKNQQSDDEQDLHAMSYTIPRGKPLQAAVTISRILLRDASKRVKDTVMKLISEESEEAFQSS